MTTERPVERRIVTVLFADLVGFTALSERLDAEDVALVQDAYFEALRDTVQRHGGLLEKFIGDAAMAVFGAPRARDDDAERAVRAGLALVAAVERVNATLGLEDATLRLRVGVNSGETLYGESTAERGPVTGDAVNVAARLQAAAAPGSVVVGGITALAVADAVELEPLEPLELKGKADPVRASRVVGLYPQRSRERALGSLRAPTLGRERELERLLGALGTAPRRICVVAPPGVGKSRLLEETAAAAERAGACLLRARLRPDALGPFEPVAQLAGGAGQEELAARLVEAGATAARARVVVHALRSADGSGVAALAGSREERTGLFEAWVEGLDALAGAAPAAWLLEDVHWASRDLLAFLEAAVRAPRAEGRLVVATTRPVLLETAAEWCAGSELLHLPPLPAAETAELVRALVGEALPPDLVDRIAAASGGNPLFVEELLRSWASAGILVTADDGGWLLGAPADEVALPATVQAIYAAQLDDLPGPARAAARRASVAGRRFAEAAFVPLGVERGEEALATLGRRALVSGPIADPALGPSYAFRHALLRDTGYASLARGERARLHARLADWLGGLARDGAASLDEVVARHYAAALDNAPALAREIEGRGRAELAAAAAEWFERASVTALGLAAWDSARALAERALELTEEAHHVDRARRLHHLAQATASAVGVDEAAALLLGALEEYRAGFDDAPAVAREGLAVAGATLGRLLRAQTRFQAAADLADELLGELAGPQEDACTARLLALRAAAVLNATDDYDRAEADAVRALDLARSAGDVALELEARQLIAHIEAERGAVDPSEWHRIEALARDAGRWDVIAEAMRIRGSFQLDEAADDALRCFDDCAELADTHGLVEAGAWSDHGRAEAHFVAGRWDDAVEAGLRAVDTGERYDLHRVVVRSWFVLVPLARARGRADLVGLAYPRFEARRGREPDSLYARIVTTATHLHFAAEGLEPVFLPEVEERLPSFDFDHSGPSWLAAVATVVGTWLDAGELDGAALALDRMRTRLAARPSTALARGTEHELRARLLLARGHAGEAAREAEHAVAELAGSTPWWRARAIRVLEQAGGASPELLDEAASIEARLGLVRTIV